MNGKGLDNCDNKVNIANNRLIEIGIRYIRLRDKKKIRIIKNIGLNK